MHVYLTAGWSGQPLTKHRVLEIVSSRYLIRLWLRPFARAYCSSRFGPLFFGIAWLGGMIQTQRIEQ